MATLGSTDQPFVFVDVETTGFKPEEGHEILEIAAQRFERGALVGTFHALLASTRPSAQLASDIHGITAEELAAKGREPSDVLPRFVDFCREATLVGHNVAFDLTFLNSALRRLDLPPLTNACVDTVELAQRTLILPSYSLERVAAFLKVVQPVSHRAMPDVETTREVYFKLLERISKRAGP